MGKKWKGNEDELHRIIGLSLQETHFIDKLRVTETIRSVLTLTGIGLVFFAVGLKIFKWH